MSVWYAPVYADSLVCGPTVPVSVEPDTDARAFSVLLAILFAEAGLLSGTGP